MVEIYLYSALNSSPGLHPCDDTDNPPPLDTFLVQIGENRALSAHLTNLLQ